MSEPFLETDNSPPPQQNSPNITLTFQPIQFTDNNAKFQAPEPDAIFVDYQVNSYYDRDKHTYMMGLTSPNGFNGQDAAFVQLAKPTVLWIVDWTASKMGRQPVSPSSTPSVGWELLDEQLQPTMITVFADGVTPVYRISGTYIYGRRKPAATLNQDISFPLPPWLENSFDRTMPNQYMQQGISDDGQLQRVR